MGRKATGTLYFSRGTWFVSLTIGKRVHIALPTCSTKGEAKVRKAIVADMAVKLRKTGNIEIAVAVCRQAGEADDQTLANLMVLVDGLVHGTEKVASLRVSVPGVGTSTGMTFREFAKLWTSNDLAHRYRGRVKEIDHAENMRKLEKHVFPIVFRDRTIGATPLDEFTLDHADHVLAQATLPERSVRHVAQVMHRVMKLAVYPARLLDRSPFPPGWLPPVPAPKERSFLYPTEEATLMGCVEIPLVRRLFFGFCAREGVRRENAVTIEWSNLTLDLPGGAGHIVLDTTKNGRGGSWSVDPGTAEALRRWRSTCPSERYVFPTEALPGYRRSRAGQPLAVGQAAEVLREALRLAGVTRAKLFEDSDHRQRLSAHDLRATFVTLALARGETEDWVRTRTGHRSSAMIAKYRREAATAAELGLGWLLPLHEAIPELALVGELAPQRAASATSQNDGTTEPSSYLGGR